MSLATSCSPAIGFQRVLLSERLRLGVVNPYTEKACADGRHRVLHEDRKLALYHLRWAQPGTRIKWGLASPNVASTDFSPVISWDNGTDQLHTLNDRKAEQCVRCH